MTASSSSSCSCSHAGSSCSLRARSRTAAAAAAAAAMMRTAAAAAAAVMMTRAAAVMMSQEAALLLLLPLLQLLLLLLLPPAGASPARPWLGLLPPTHTCCWMTCVLHAAPTSCRCSHQPSRCDCPLRAWGRQQQAPARCAMMVVLAWRLFKEQQAVHVQPYLLASLFPCWLTHSS
jgi:hypothetical protein